MTISKLFFILVVSCVFSPRAAQCQTVDAKQGNTPERIGRVVLKKDIEFPDKKTAPFPRLIGNNQFPLLGKTKIGNIGYYLLILDDVNVCKRPALVPFHDERGNPSVEEHLDSAVIDNAVGLKAYLGYYPLKAGQELPVISSSKGKYVARYTFNGCNENLEVAEADVVFTSIEQERAQERKLNEERLKREMEEQLARVKFIAEQKAKGLVEHEGRWMTPQQAAQQAAEAQRQAAEAMAAQRAQQEALQKARVVRIEQLRRGAQSRIYTLKQIRDAVLEYTQLIGGASMNYAQPVIDLLGPPDMADVNEVDRGLRVTSSRTLTWWNGAFNQTTQKRERVSFHTGHVEYLESCGERAYFYSE